MKIIHCDNYNRESQPEYLVCENITNEREGKIMLSALQDNPNRSDEAWYKLMPDDYHLWRGMEDLI